MRQKNLYITTLFILRHIITFKGTVMQIEKALINDRLRVSKAYLLKQATTKNDHKPSQTTTNHQQTTSNHHKLPQMTRSDHKPPRNDYELPTNKH